MGIKSFSPHTKWVLCTVLSDAYLGGILDIRSIMQHFIYCCNEWNLEVMEHGCLTSSRYESDTFAVGLTGYLFICNIYGLLADNSCQKFGNSTCHVLVFHYLKILYQWCANPITDSYWNPDSKLFAATAASAAIAAPTAVSEGRNVKDWPCQALS